MKNLAEFKRAIIPGVKLHTIWHQATKKDDQGNVCRTENGHIEYTDEDRGEREVSIVQTTQFALKTLQKGEYKDSWITFPKASQTKFNDDGSVTILEPDYRIPAQPLIPILTYKFV